MPRTAVVTDSTSYLPPELLAGNSIGIVSLYVNFGPERAERETDLMKDLDAFYDEVRSADQWPTTSQPSVGDFVEAWEPLLADGSEVVSIHISEAISGTCDSARQAAELLEREGKGGERVRVVNSESAAGGMGMVVLGAARVAAGGADADAVAARAKEVRNAEDVVRRGHARVPQAQRPDRRGERMDRLDAQDQAHPHARAGDHADRAGAHQRPRFRADGRLRGGAPRGRRERLGRPAHPVARRGRAARRALPPGVREPIPSSSPRSGPCSACTRARASWASAACKRTC